MSDFDRLDYVLDWRASTAPIEPFMQPPPCSGGVSNPPHAPAGELVTVRSCVASAEAASVARRVKSAESKAMASHVIRFDPKGKTAFDQTEARSLRPATRAALSAERPAHGARTAPMSLAAERIDFRQAAGLVRHAAQARSSAVRLHSQRSGARCSDGFGARRRGAARSRWHREVIDDVQQVRLAALVGAAVPLDEAAAKRELVAERPRLGSAAHDRIEPAFDQSLLGREATTRRRSQRSPASTRSAAKAGVLWVPTLSASDGASPCACRRGPNESRLREVRRQQRGESGTHRLVVVTRSNSPSATLTSRRRVVRAPALEVGNTQMSRSHQERSSARSAGDHPAPARPDRSPLGLGDARQRSM